MGKAKITVTLDESLVEALGHYSTMYKKSRSRLVEEAVDAWRRSQTEQKLIEGYRAMTIEDVKTAEDLLPVGIEVITRD